jgi:hypothetical protein
MIISLPSPRYMLIHSHNATLDANQLDPRAHAFGPFDNYDALVAFDATFPKDSCYRIAVPLVGPAIDDVGITALGYAIGAHPASLSLPPRGDETPVSEPLNEQNAFTKSAYSIDETMKRLQKRLRKEAKREAKRSRKILEQAKQDGIEP